MPTPQTNGVHDPLEAEILYDQVNSREAKIAELEQESAVLRDQVTLLEAEVGHMCTHVTDTTNLTNFSG